MAIQNNQNQDLKNQKRRHLMYGANSLVIILLVLVLLIGINYVAIKFPKSYDTTRKGLNSLSEQSIKTAKSVKQDLKATLVVKLEQKDRLNDQLKMYATANNKITIDVIDPVREPAKAKVLGFTGVPLLVMAYRDREGKVTEPNEEKITNELIRLQKDRKPTFCSIEGHGELSFEGQAAPLSTVKKGLEGQFYAVRSVELSKEKGIPAECDAIQVLGPTNTLPPEDLKIIGDYLAKGGRALIAPMFDVQDRPLQPNLNPILNPWFVKVEREMILDPSSRIAGVDASWALVTPDGLSREHSITQGSNLGYLVPSFQTLQIMPNAPESLKVNYLMKSSRDSLATADMSFLKTGQLKNVKKGPFDLAITVAGKAVGSTAEKETRIVVFGGALFAANEILERFSQNYDLYLNTVSWLLQDEDMISIRVKEDDAGKVELSQNQLAVIGLTIFLLVMSIYVAGVVIWWKRRKL